MRWPIFTSTRFGPSFGLSLIVGSSVLLSFFANFASWVKSEWPSYIKHDHIYLDQRWVNFANDLLAAAAVILQMKVKMKGSILRMTLVVDSSLLPLVSFCNFAKTSLNFLSSKLPIKNSFLSTFSKLQKDLFLYLCSVVKEFIKFWLFIPF